MLLLFSSGSFAAYSLFFTFVKEKILPDLSPALQTLYGRISELYNANFAIQIA